MNAKTIRKMLAQGPGRANPGARPDFGRAQIAAAALLVECARIDAEFHKQERAAIYRIVRERFGLDDATAESLIAVAERRTDEVWDDWLFTQAIRQSFDAAELREIIMKLWEVAYADGTLRRCEERLIGRIGKELGMSDQALEEARASARARLAGGEAGGG